MIELKTEFKIKFNTITDFSQHVRKLVSPFLAFAENVRFENVNRPSERAYINFPEDDMIITADWNNLGVIVIGQTTNLDDYDNKLRFFYELLGNIKKLDTFVGFEYSILRTWDLLPGIYEDYESFKEVFYTNLPKINSINDCAVILEGELDKEKLGFNCRFGPLNYPDDIEHHNLSLFNNSAFVGSETPTEGCLVNNTLQSFSNEFDYMEMKKIQSGKNNLINSIPS